MMAVHQLLSDDIHHQANNVDNDAYGKSFKIHSAKVHNYLEQHKLLEKKRSLSSRMGYFYEYTTIHFNKLTFPKVFCHQ
jgi:hypothetical protein